MSCANFKIVLKYIDQHFFKEQQDIEHETNLLRKKEQGF